MKLNSLALKNVRSHKDSVVNFGKGINVITGKTGSGKSSILMGVDYALFGSSNYSNAEIMRRGSREMVVELIFEHAGKTYTIIRGLKKSGNNIVVDSDNLRVLENGKGLNIMPRSSDIDMAVAEILGIPENVKGSEMFQVISYTKQDEIRKLLEMRREERQEYIDRILQLSKYKTTFENLKSVADYFRNNLNEIGKVEEFLGKEREEFEKLNERQREARAEINDNDKKRAVLEKALNQKENEKKNLRMIINDLKTVVAREREKKSRLEGLKEELLEKRRNIAELDCKRKDVENNINALKMDDGSEKIRKELSSGEAGAKVLEENVKRLKDDEKNIGKIGGKCPLCRQVITEKHWKEVRLKIKNEINIFAEKLENLGSELITLREKLGFAVLREKLLNELAKFDSNIGLLEESARDLETKMASLKINDVNEKEELLEKSENELNFLIEKDRELFSKSKSINDRIEYLNEEVKKLEYDSAGKLKSIQGYELQVKDKDKVSYLIKYLDNLRNYVKDIRSVIRQKFLSDFKNEFQKKFEEIRNYEDEYNVEVGFDYEPIAYTLKGEAVHVDYLSGGEKTSVALAYRLALSDLAAQMSNVMPAELLILDEPTTGFDSEDIKSLPEVLKNITSIPQIIIVTHEELLKEIADVNIEVRKSLACSTVEY
ncbi:hypothetical protein COX58_02030 [archaeon CG_4_10_14_0_2_um_filter_Archaea_38_6]|nr:MAG: hypothetical protein COS64_03765 [archaeon CG06_land_8_20_14_3_00_37_11]PJA22507.1 MAG: hypothetical protein COX58_02030 [archaeon CG_4_10_14_0_2_um_filter_Archaea_38_6]